MTRKAGSFRAGRRTRLIDFRGQQLLLVRTEDLGSDVPREIRREVVAANIHRFGPAVKGGLWGVVGALSSWLVPALLGRGGFQFASAAGFVVLGMCIAVMVLVGVFFGTMLARRRGIAAVRACLNAALCPSCGYPLVGLRTENDGCVICGECGGAWKAL